MSFQVFLSEWAQEDLDRLEAWLLDKNPRAALQVGEVLLNAVVSLADLPRRGRGSGFIREINVRFGGSTYVLRYYIEGDAVVVTRVFHGREDR